MSMSTISGVSQVQIDGVQYAVSDGLAKFSMATINREPVVSKSGAIFIKETPEAAKVSFELLVPGTVDVSTFNGLKSSSVVVQLANGSTITGNSMATSGSCEYDANEGKIALEFFGQTLTVTLNG